MNSKCIIVEGPQGCGKTTLTNYLRENLASANLYRLTGQKDKTINGKEKSKQMYLALLRYMKEIENCDVNLIFDRTFFSEQVYALLGYKDYDFTDVYNILLQRLGELKFDILYFNLYLKNIELFRERLARPSHHGYHAFSLETSVKQQDTYKSLIPEIKKSENTNVYEIAVDNYEEAYNEIKNIVGLSNKSKKLKL